MMAPPRLGVDGGRGVSRFVRRAPRETLESAGRRGVRRQVVARADEFKPAASKDVGNDREQRIGKRCRVDFFMGSAQFADPGTLIQQQVQEPDGHHH